MVLFINCAFGLRFVRNRSVRGLVVVSHPSKRDCHSLRSVFCVDGVAAFWIVLFLKLTYPPSLPRASSAKRGMWTACEQEAQSVFKKVQNPRIRRASTALSLSLFLRRIDRIIGLCNNHSLHFGIFLPFHLGPP